MKTLHYLLGLLIICIWGQTQAQNTIPNANFENWTADTLYHLWEGYNTSNSQSTFYTGSPNVTVVPSPFGRAAHLEARIQGTDSIKADLILGAFCPTGFMGGIPFSSSPDSVVAWIKHDIASPDQGSIVLVYKMDEMMVGFNFCLVQGNRPNYYRFAHALAPPAQPYNQLAVLVQAGAEGRVHDGSWLEIDSIALIGSNEQLPNASFEQTRLLHFEDPVDWASPNISLGLFGQTVGIHKSTDAFAGQYAARIQTVAFESNCEPDTLGFLQEGDWEVIEGQDGGIPFHMARDSMRYAGYYKYDAVGSDTALAALLFTHYDHTSQSRDTVWSIIKALQPTASYMRFEAIIRKTDFPIMPDSIHIIFQASDEEQFASQAIRGVGSTLWIDSLSLEPIVTDVIDQREIAALRIFPNPTRDLIHLSWEAQAGLHYQAQLVDLQGKVHREALFTNGKGSWNLQQLATGMYILILEEQETGRRSSVRVAKIK